MSAHEEPRNTEVPDYRGTDGRFITGNPGGPGNPFARRVAHIKRRLLERLTDDKLDALIDKLIDLGIEGDVAAAKVVLQYALGKPVEQPHPDRLDADEVEAFRANATTNRAQEMVQATPARPFLAVARELLPSQGAKVFKQLQEGIRARMAA